MNRKLLAVLSLMCLLAGCGSADGSQLPPDQLDAYQQMALYIQEGLRRYGIDGTYQAFFGPIEEAGSRYVCDVLLEGEDGLWPENVAYTREEDAGWYAFSGQYEPILFQDEARSCREDDVFVTELREDCRYQTAISRTSNLGYSVRYHSQSGPIERTTYLYSPFSAESMWLYTYQDDRLDTNIAILYPHIAYAGEQNDTINAHIKDAFFYGYYFDDGAALAPANYPYTEISRHYSITRNDGRYLSMRIYEDNCTRGASHPNEWETGLTVDLRTGETLCLSDVVGDKWTLEALLESEAFQSIWSIEGGQRPLSEIIGFAQSGGASLEDYDASFYLTDGRLGLIVEFSRYYTCIEASLEDLGLTAFIN